MQTRKLQEVGGGTYTVSIPKEWATDNRLEAGAEIHLYRHRDGSIVVRDAEIDGGVLASATVAIEGEAPALVTRAVRATYANGFETVTLVPGTTFTAGQRRALRAAVRDLVGTEIEAAGPERLRLRNYLDADDVSVRQSAVQLQYVALSIHREATDAFTAGRDATERLGERAAEAERLQSMLRRHLTRAQTSLAEVDHLGRTRPSLLEHYRLARCLAGVAEAALDLAAAIVPLAAAPPDVVATGVDDLADEARRVVELAATALSTKADAVTVNEALDAAAALQPAITVTEATLFDEPCPATTPLVEPSSPAAPLDVPTARTVTRALDSLRRTGDLAESIASVALEATTRTANLPE